MRLFLSFPPDRTRLIAQFRALPPLPERRRMRTKKISPRLAIVKRLLKAGGQTNG